MLVDGSGTAIARGGAVSVDDLAALAQRHRERLAGPAASEHRFVVRGDRGSVLALAAGDVGLLVARIRPGLSPGRVWEPLEQVARGVAEALCS